MRGLNLELEKQQQSPEDWKFGAASQPGLVSIPEAERDQYLPQGETQFTIRGDFNDCASRSPVNHLEALFTYHYLHGMQIENKAWLQDKGYIKDSRVVLSDRYVAVNSGTTRQGNSLKAPLEAIRKQGLIPKSLLPKKEEMTWDEYYAPISQELKTLGTEFTKRFTINYEQVSQIHFADALKDDLLGVAGYAWPLPVNGIYPRTEGQAFNHAFLLYKLPKFQAFDNYEEQPGDFTKSLAPDYAFYDYAYRVYLSAEYTSKDFEKGNILAQVWQTLYKFGLTLFFPKFVEDFEKPATITIPATVPPAPEPKRLLWDVPADARHSTRVICDELGLTLQEKNLICAVIMAESGFHTQAVNRNKNSRGEVISTDYGICQINDYWNIGPGKPFSSITEVLSNPEKSVRFMISMMKAKKLNLWWAYKNGSYLKYL